MEKIIKSTLNEKVLEINLNREKVYNALNRQSKLELIDEITQAGKNPEVGAIILTASGRAFCTGQDLNDRAVRASEGERPNLEKALNEEWNPLIKSIKTNPKIIIGAINGMAVGAGMSIALACDYIIAHSGTYFMAGFSKIGLTPDAGLTHIITSTYTRSQSLEILLLNKKITSSEALSTGLINNVSENPLDEARVLAKSFSNMAPLSIREIKSNINYSIGRNFEESLKKETESQKLLGSSEDYIEGVKAFFEKRSPNFKGK